MGPDETGNVGTGMYRLVDGGRRYLPGHWPTTPVKLFDPAGTVTIYPADKIPPTSCRTGAGTGRRTGEQISARATGALLGGP